MDPLSWTTVICNVTTMFESGTYNEKSEEIETAIFLAEESIQWLKLTLNDSCLCCKYGNSLIVRIINNDTYNIILHKQQL